MLQENIVKNDNMCDLLCYSQIAKLFDRPSYMSPLFCYVENGQKIMLRKRKNDGYIMWDGNCALIL